MSETLRGGCYIMGAGSKLEFLFFQQQEHLSLMHHQERGQYSIINYNIVMVLINRNKFLIAEIAVFYLLVSRRSAVMISRKNHIHT